METVWWVFKKLYEKGLVYEGYRVVPYCPRCSTSLSNFASGSDLSVVQYSIALFQFFFGET